MNDIEVIGTLYGEAYYSKQFKDLTPGETFLYAGSLHLKLRGGMATRLMWGSIIPIDPDEYVGPVSVIYQVEGDFYAYENNDECSD